MNYKDKEIIEIAKDVKWVGILDFDIRTFDIVMHTEHGTTYNSYFINAGKKVLIEVAKEKFSDTYLQKIRSVTDPEDIDYIILNHTEPDHSGSLEILLDLAPSATVVGSGNAIRYLGDMLNKPFRSLVVKDGDTLDLGNKTLRFINAPNLHWPDSIYTYLEEDRILFTCDSFGAHYCDPLMRSKLTDEYIAAFRYYFDVILKPYSKFMIRAIEKIEPLDMVAVCPGHGPIHYENHREVISFTRKLSEEYLQSTGEKAVKNVLITYISAYGYTKEAAFHIASGISGSGNFNVDVTDIETISAEDLDSKLTISDAILVGSPTINQNTLMPVYKLMALVNPIRDRGKIAGAFGSYGWSGEASRIINETLKNLKLVVCEEPAAFKFSPGASKKDYLIEFGKRFAEKIIESENAGGVTFK